MANELQIEANRANALKSTGPSSPEGCRISSQNSTRHGMLAKAIVVKGESLERFALLLSALQDEFQPRTSAEHGLIETMAVARWRQMRLWNYETASLSDSIAKRQASQEGGHSDPEDNPTRAAMAFRELCERDSGFQVMHRYETAVDRQYNRALTRLLALQKQKENSTRTQFEYD